MDEPKLRSCPFCGSEVFKYGGIAQNRNAPSKLCRIMCLCGAEGPDAYGERDAIAAWNSRAGESQ
jgi:Lar family restriction alleviation protein